MKTKFLLIVLCTILLSMTVSAVDLIDVTSPSVLTKSRTTTSFDIESKVVDNVTLLMAKDIETIEDGDGRELTLTITPDIFLPLSTTGDTRTVNIETDVDPEFDFDDIDFGKHTLATLTLTASNGTETEEQTITVSFVNSFCEVGSFGELEIIEVKDKTIDNEDPWDWKPLDDVEFRVEVGNNFDDKERVKVEYEIYDEDGRKVKFDDENNDQSVSIDEDETEWLTFELRVPADMDDGTYKLFIKAYVKGHEKDEGCVDNADSEELNEIYYQEVTISRDEDRAVVVDTDKLDLPDSTLCGEFATVYVKVYNTGEEDEDRVLVNLFNQNLNINTNEVITDLRDGGSEVVTFNFKIPENVEEKGYIFRITTFYEYDEDEGDSDDMNAYDSNSDYDLDEDFNFNLNVNCIPEKEVSVDVSVDPEQEYEAVAGQEVTINVDVENTGDETEDLSVEIEGFESWATEEKIVPRLVTLDAGESKEVSVTLSIDEDLEEADWQTFSVQVLSEGEVVEDRELEIFVEKSSSQAPVTGDVIANHFRDNWFIWVIIIINVVLIIAIILVARRIVTAK